MPKGTIYTGKVKYRDERDRWDNGWEDVLYLDDDRVETIVAEYRGKCVRITIEEVDEDSLA